jgi:hypothetical protein
MITVGLYEVYLGINLVYAKNRDGPPVADGGGALQSIALQLQHLTVQTGAVIEMEASKVQLSYVPGVVHVSEEDVHILRRAEACQQCTAT